MILRIPALLSLTLIFHIEKAFTQSTPEDSILRRSAYQHTAVFYYEQLGDQTVLNNGSRYEKYPRPFRLGSAYFLTDQFTTGSVVYDGISFDSVSLLFDELQQLLVLRKDGYDLQLVSERISAFTISGHAFLRLSAGSAHPGLPGTRFYEVLYSGPSRILKLTDKTIQEEAFLTEGIPKYMVTRDDYYMKWGKVYVQVNSKDRLLELLKDHKKEIRRFIEKNQLGWEDKEILLVRVAGYYDQLVK